MVGSLVRWAHVPSHYCTMHECHGECMVSMQMLLIEGWPVDIIPFPECERTMNRKDHP